MANKQNDTVRSNKWELLFDWLGTIVFTFILIVFMATFIGHQFQVQQTSMNPTLYEGDRVVVRSILYTPRNGDIVVFSKENYGNGQLLVKRVIATGGQTVDIDGEMGTVAVDGQILNEEYLPEGLATPAFDVPFPVTVPEGSIFVMGDNRGGSMDSRMLSVGFIDEREVVGKVVAVIAPLSHFGLY